MSNRHIEIVEKYLESLKKKDLSLAPLAEDLSFDDPVPGKGQGAENFRAFLSGFLPAVTDVKVIRHVCENDFVVTQFEVDGLFGKIPVLEIFRIADDKIAETTVFYDPRPILGG